MADIDLESMEKLIALMVANDLSEVQYEHGELKIELRRGCGQAAVAATAPTHIAQAPTTPALAADPSDSASPADEHEGLVAIPSPMVGTFYSAPDPESPPFVGVGATVDRESVVCLIEAMKVFNEIKAEVSGTIEKTMARNEDPVEYGQVLFYVRPD